MNIQRHISKYNRSILTTYPLYPIFDIEERESHYVLCLDGRVFYGEEIEIALEKDDIIIRGVGDGEHLSAFSPKDVVVKSNGEMIATHYKDGVLYIALPKRMVALSH